MPKPEIEARIVALRLETRDGDSIWVEIDPGRNVDAVFTSTDAVKRILMPFYERENPKRAKELGQQIQKQVKQRGVFLAPHQASCKTEVPPIRRGQGSPIRI